MSVQTRLEQARYAIGRGVTQRRACTLMSVARSGLVYACKMPMKDGPIIKAMRDYSAQYPRYGARRVRIFLRRDGMVLGRDRTARIWAAAGLQVPAKKPKKRYRSQERQPFVATGPNQVWAYDFVFDGCANGDKLKCLTMIDEFTKESLHIDVAGSIRSKRLIQVLEQLIKERGCPMVLRSDHGPEFVSIALLQWAADKGLRNLLIEPGKPWQNGTNESFNGKFRDECLAMNWFYSRAHAKVIIESWRKHYNAVRPHSSLA
ncbi:MAG: IS3 family transposase, partial [Betaproteobacteria bacterium]|nr:IS3 family transposase [Betaproteobacteria bacterium]